MKKTTLLALLFSSIGSLWAQAPFKGQKLGTEINSAYDEIAPMLSPDGRRLYFVRAFHPENTGGEQTGQDIWFAEKQSDGKWSPAQRLSTPLNNRYDNAVGGISQDGKTLLLTHTYSKKGKKQLNGISKSTLQGTEWSMPETLLDDKVVSREGFLHFYATPDLKTLVISMRNAENQSEDLYVSFAQADGTWSAPALLGNLNTTGNELSPSLSADGKTLFFASDKHNSLGGTDIFMSRRLDETWTNWSTPENLGESVNTRGFDAYFVVDEATQTAYFNSGDTPGDLGDIYSIRLQDIPLLRKEEPKPEPPVAKVDPKPEPPVTKEEIPFNPPSETKPAPTPAARFFDDVLFDFAKSAVRTSETIKLDKLVEHLRANPNTKVNIKGFTDDRGTDEFNLKLSRQRCFSVRGYLIARGIDARRITDNANGEAQPKASNETDEGRQLNRRVELELVEEAKK